MRSRNRTPNSPRWPFWLLLAAWLCANTPQTATFVVLTWLSEARSFSHNERLVRDVAFLLNGEKAPGIIDAAKNLPAEEPKAPLPAQVALKKLDLTLERTTEVLPPALRANRRLAATTIPREVLRDAPPTEPPRCGVS